MWLVELISSWSNYRRFKKLTPDKRSIVFYSESGQDWHHFKPIIEYLTGQLSRTVCYISSDPSDRGLDRTDEKILSFYIKEGLLQIVFFQFLKADVMVLTMIDLGVFQLKRSINPVHYIYLFHAMGSTHMVDYDNSYDNYDTIFCVGPHQIQEIRKREKLKQLPPKNLFEHGYARLEQLMEIAHDNAKCIRSSEEKPVILLAPTWGDNSILNICGDSLIGTVLDAGYRLILRPHYQTIKLSPEIIDSILKKYSNHSCLQFVDNMGDVNSLLESDLLICDWSSTSIEYALGLEKPVLFIDVPRRVRNPYYKELGIEPMEVTIRKKIGTVLSPLELNKVPLVIEVLLGNRDQFRQNVKELRNELVFNLGKSAEKGALEIARITGEQKQKRDYKKEYAYSEV